MRATDQPAPKREDIERLAYAIWESRGCGHGNDVEQWMEAERELQADRGESAMSAEA